MEEIIEQEVTHSVCLSKNNSKVSRHRRLNAYQSFCVPCEGGEWCVLDGGGITTSLIFLAYGQASLRTLHEEAMPRGMPLICVPVAWPIRLLSSLLQSKPAERVLRCPRVAFCRKGGLKCRLGGKAEKDRASFCGWLEPF